MNNLTEAYQNAFLHWSKAVETMVHDRIKGAGWEPLGFSTGLGRNDAWETYFGFQRGEADVWFYLRAVERGLEAWALIGKGPTPNRFFDQTYSEGIRPVGLADDLMQATLRFNLD